MHKLLRRFLDVCNAIEYAHGRGVLHRDIKPGNVIVGRHGETLVVDWGLAKVQGRTDADSSDERPLMPSSASGSAETLPGSALGTPAYMSPEQARGDLEHLGPQSDVYSLGATLYCLLTGRPPVENDDFGAVLRAVQRGEFPPPRQLDPALDQALEAICLKAMALKPEDRYSSPGARRGRGAVDGRRAGDRLERAGLPPGAAVGAAKSHGGGGRGRGAGSRRGRAGGRRGCPDAGQRPVALANQATPALDDTRKAQAETQAALRQSEESRKQAEAVSAFLVQAFRSPDPSRDGRQVKVVRGVGQGQRAARQGVHGIPGDPGDAAGRPGPDLPAAWACSTGPSVCTRRPAPYMEAALGPDHPQTLASRNNLANAYMSAGRTSEAIALHEATLKLFESKLGPDHPETLQCRNDLAVDYWFAGQNAKAIAMHEETLKLRESKLGPDHPDTLQSRQNLAIAYSTGRMSEAIAMFKEVLRLQEKKLGPDHPHTLESRNDLAGAYREAGRLSEATALDEETLKLRESRLGPDHPETTQQSRQPGPRLLRTPAGCPRRSRWTKETLKLRESKLGPDHPDTLISRINLADAYRDAGRIERRSR